ncbi:MAG: acetyl-CoA carboxylase biotin carboxyl carrier protein subunit [candidate division WOR-3 bacterium]
MKNKILDLPGTPLKIIIKNNKFLTFYIEHKGNKALVYSPYGNFLLEKKIKENLKEGREDNSRIISPMSGKIVKVFKREKEKVNIDEPLCIIEAMKMQNEIRSKKEGIIIKSFAEEEKIIKKGELIFIIE